MDRRTLDQILSSGVRLRIVDSLSVRPRTLRELASLTGITVQGVLRHLKILMTLGLVDERKLPIKGLKARTVYASKGYVVGDHSTPDLVVVKPTKRPAILPVRGASDLEGTSGDILVLQRRVKDQVRRLGRVVDELVEEQEELRGALDGLDLGPEGRLILEVALTEETLADGLRVLSKYYGIEDRRSIEKALAEAKRSVGK
jgi:DNA-binding transcriptional ArsR family regulator